MYKKVKKKLKKPIRYTIHQTTKHSKRLFSLPLEAFRFNSYSQHGEDGVIEELLRQLGIKSGWVVEFGAWDGMYLSNTFSLIKNNSKFKAIYIEGDAPRYQDLLSTVQRFKKQITPIHAFVAPYGQNSLDNLLNQIKIPKDFELLSIDVDSIDYQIWDNFKQYKPKIVIIEINCSIPLGKTQIHDKDKKLMGSSFTSMLELGNKKGYTLVHHYGNMFFVRNDLVSKMKMDNKYLNNPEKLFKFKG